MRRLTCIFHLRYCRLRLGLLGPNPIQIKEDVFAHLCCTSIGQPWSSSMLSIPSREAVLSWNVPSSHGRGRSEGSRPCLLLKTHARKWQDTGQGRKNNPLTDKGPSERTVWWRSSRTDLKKQCSLIMEKIRKGR